MNSIIRTKTVRKWFKKDWPLTVDKITIYNMAGTTVYTTINNEHFAINGKAQDVLKLPHLIDSKYYIKDKSITPLIEVWLSLFSSKELIKQEALHNQMKEHFKNK